MSVGIKRYQAGPELDTILAEKVMGWIRINEYWFDPNDLNASYGVRYTHNSGDYDFDDFEPSTKMEMTWIIVFKVMETKRIKNFSLSYNSDKQNWQAQFDSVLIHAQTPQLALCLASYKRYLTT